MSNESLFVVRALVDIVLIVFACRFFGKKGLYAAIAANLILVSLFGAKLVSYFGLVTNAGNIFYASVFFATQLLTEHWGREEGNKTIGFGIFTLVFYVVLGFISLYTITVPQTADVAMALERILSFAPRIVFGSMLAYVVASWLNIEIYDHLHQRDGRKRLWLRSFIAILVSQLLDSVIFFTIAFAGSIEVPVLVQTIFVGFAAKVIVGIIAIPFLYGSYRFTLTFAERA